MRHPAAAVVPAETHALTQLADLADKGREVDDRVMGQFAVMSALQRPGAAELGAGLGEQLGQFTDLVGRDAGDARGPVGRLGGAVILALDIGDPAVRAGCVFVHVGAVFQTLFQHVMRHAQEQRDVRVRDDLHPIRIQVIVGRGALRVDRDEAAARVADLGPGAGHAVIGHGELDPVVLDGVAADENEDLGVVAHDLPCGLGGIDLHVADDVGQGHLACAGREVALRDGAAADQVEEALLHDVRAERAGIRPAAIGGAEDRLVAVFLDRLDDGMGGQGQGGVPIDLDKFLAPAQFRLGVAALPAVQIGLADHRIKDAAVVIGAVHDAQHQHVGGLMVEFRDRRNRSDAPIPHDRLEGAVMRGMEDPLAMRVRVDGSKSRAAHQVAKAGHSNRCRTGLHEATAGDLKCSHGLILLSCVCSV